MILALIRELETPEQQDLATDIFKKHYTRMLKIAYDVLNNYADAEDAAMDTVRAICLHIDEFEKYSEDEILMLISRCTKNRAIDIYRKNQKNSERFETIDVFEGSDCADSNELLDEMFISRKNNELLLQALQEMDEMYSTPIILQYLKDMTHDAIAEYMNINTSTVAGRIFRGRKILANKIIEMGYER